MTSNSLFVRLGKDEPLKKMIDFVTKSQELAFANSCDITFNFNYTSIMACYFQLETNFSLLIAADLMTALRVNSVYFAFAWPVDSLCCKLSCR